MITQTQQLIMSGLFVLQLFRKGGELNNGISTERRQDYALVARG